MKRFLSVLAFILIVFVAHHSSIYLHEWTHGAVAWLTGYKPSPFHIHYGVEWITLWDIEEAVDYSRIFADGKPSVVAWIAIAPMLLQATFFLVALKALKSPKIQNNRWLFTFFYFYALFALCDIYCYIPIRTFSGSDDMFNFLTATGLSPWTLVIPGVGFLAWGMDQLLRKQVPQAYISLQITTKLGRFLFKFLTLALFFGYYAGIGFSKPDQTTQALAQISWGIFLFSLVILCIQSCRKKRS
jgi:hypothetical protein